MRDPSDVLAVAEAVVETGLLENKDPQRVRNALAADRKRFEDLALLLSPGAEPILEELARSARRITLERFGRVVGLYAPIYLTNFCVGDCPYCGFRADLDVRRRALGPEEIDAEVRSLAASGLRHVLFVAGDDPRSLDVDFLAHVAEQTRQVVPSVAVEIPSLPEEAYRRLEQAGVDGVTLYQETYDRGRYEALHSRGPKADFVDRLGALDRAGAAGMRRLQIGFLGGLAPWRREALTAGIHAALLARRHWRSQLLVGLPRLKHVPDDFEIPHPLDDRALAHIIAALRNFFPDLGLVVSTRELAALRDRLVPIGVTHMSAGSRTEPGGYTEAESSAPQFEVADRRSPAEVAAALKRRGYDPVVKDWDRGFGPEVKR